MFFNEKGKAPVLNFSEKQALCPFLLFQFSGSEIVPQHHLVEMYMAIYFMIVNAKDMLAAGEFAFPAFKRSFCFFHGIGKYINVY